MSVRMSLIETYRGDSVADVTPLGEFGDRVRRQGHNEHGKDQLKDMDGESPWTISNFAINLRKHFVHWINAAQCDVVKLPLSSNREATGFIGKL